MAKIVDLISDVELRLTKGNVSDDFQVDRRQIRFWLDIIRSELIEEKERVSGMQELSDFVRLYECVDIDERKVDCGGECNDKVYEVALPVSVSQLRHDLGVYRVETSGGKTIHRTRITERNRIRNLKFAFPNNSRIIYHRVKDTLVIEGGTNNFKENGKVNLYLIPEDTSGFDEDEEYPIDASLIPMLLDRAETIGRRELGSPEDVENDGKQQ